MRNVLARAILAGALGRGWTARVDGESVFAEGGTRGDRPSRVRIDVAGGVARYACDVGALELARVAQAVGVGAATSIACVLALEWLVHLALPAGFAAGAALATTRIALARRRWRARVEALIQSSTSEASRR